MGRLEAVVVIVKVDVPVEPGPDKLTLGKLSEIARPIVEGDTEPVKSTLPVKPRLFNVMVDVAEPPATKLEEGAGAPALMVKSAVTVTVAVAV